jgi:FkbM family methyltransferase
MSLSALRAAYNDHKIEKHDFIDKTHQFHKALFEYASIIPSTDITKIEIDESGVHFTVKHRALSYEGGGVRFYVDPQDQRVAPIEALNFNTYEESDFSMITKLLRPGQTVLDIGGNIGFYSLSLAKQFPTSRFHAFEPIPKTFAQLKGNLEMNNISNVSIYNFGFSNERKTLTFYFYPEGSGNASSARLSERDSVEEVTCSVITVDEFVKENGLRVDFIKCDVEGAELLVFQGANSVLDTHRPIVFSEMLRKWSKKFNYDPNEIFELFRSKNYGVYTSAHGELLPFTTMTEETLETNFFFLPNA